MDALVFDGAATACTLAALAWSLGKGKRRSPAAPRPRAVARSVRQLRRRHRRIARSVIELAQECLARHPDGSFEAFTARETLQTYLPDTLGAYLSVPAALRRGQRKGGPSADDELSRQLWTLQAGLERIRDADGEAGAARMAANGTFLDERFAAPPRALPPEHRSLLHEVADVIEGALRRA